MSDHQTTLDAPVINQHQVEVECINNLGEASILRAEAAGAVGARTLDEVVARLDAPRDEGMHQRFEVKVPDTLSETRSVNMEFHYRDVFGANAIPEAYERLLLDALQGDASLFTRSDGIENSWRVIEPFLQGWAGPRGPELAFYKPGAWGPDAADAFLAADGRRWLRGCAHED